MSEKRNANDLIRKNGPLAPVWIAGTMKDRLGKKLVLSTNIADVARTIMNEESVTNFLRLSGMLLKGVVVVYSKKTQYMLVDCEDVINKIMQSFKLGAGIDMTLAKNADQQVTVHIRTDKIAELTTDVNLSEWQASDAESRFMAQAGPIDFEVLPNSQAISQPFSQLTDGSSSLSESSSNSQAIQLDDLPVYNPLEMNQSADDGHQWDSVAEDVPTWADDDMPPPPDMDDSVDEDADNEPEAPKRRRAPKERIVDDVDGEGQQRARARRRTRQTAATRQIALPQNEELENLFEIARQFAQPPTIPEAYSSDDNVPAPDFMAGGFTDDDGPDQERDVTAPPPPFGTSDDGGVDMPMSDNEMEPEVRRLSSAPGRLLESPFPNYPIRIQATPKRSVDTSITTDTIRTMNELRESLSDRDEVTFNQVFAGRSRHQIAKGFYQLMVLKSVQGIDLMQERPYGDIVIGRGPRFDLGQ